MPKAVIDRRYKVIGGIALASDGRVSKVCISFREYIVSLHVSCTEVLYRSCFLRKPMPTCGVESWGEEDINRVKSF